MQKNGRTKGLDKIDCQIIEFLQKDGRMPNTDIARKLGVSESTVRVRVNRLIEEEYLQIVAVSNPIKLGFGVVGDIRMHVNIKKMDSILKELRELKALWFIVCSTGNIDVIAEFVVESMDELKDLIFEKINKIDGVRSTETNIFMQFVKRRYDWGTACEEDGSESFKNNLEIEASDQFTRRSDLIPPVATKTNQNRSFHPNQNNTLHFKQLLLKFIPLVWF